MARCNVRPEPRSEIASGCSFSTANSCLLHGITQHFSIPGLRLARRRRLDAGTRDGRRSLAGRRSPAVDASPR